MVVNNWFVTVNMYTGIMGPQSVFFVRAYFVIFWIVVVLIQLNLIIAIILEIFGNVAFVLEERQHKQYVTTSLMGFFKGDDEARIRLKIEEAKILLRREEERLEQLLAHGDQQKAAHHSQIRPVSSTAQMNRFSLQLNRDPRTKQQIMQI